MDEAADRIRLSSDLHHFFLFRLAHVFHFLDFIIRKLLDFLERSFLIIFRDLLVFHGLLDCVIAIATDIAHCRAMLLQDFMKVLNHVLAAFFG